MNRRTGIVCIWLAALLLLNGCGAKQKEQPEGSFVYYVNATGSGLVSQEFEGSKKTPGEEVEEILNVMDNPKDPAECSPAVPAGVEVEGYKLNRGRLDLYWNAAYGEMEKTAEVLCRAAVVQSLAQVDGVDFVSFYVDGSPLKDKSGNSVGYMRAEDFVQNTGADLSSYKKATMNLYYANGAGNHLVKETVSVRYNSNMLLEKAIVEQLLKGPAGKEERATLPEGSKLLGITVKDGICYVNFDERFAAPGYEMDPHIAVYSLVNSIVEAGNCSQVQISVEGETNLAFQEVVDLSKPIAANFDLVEEIE